VHSPISTSGRDLRTSPAWPYASLSLFTDACSLLGTPHAGRTCVALSRTRIRIRLQAPASLAWRWQNLCPCTARSAYALKSSASPTRPHASEFARSFAPAPLLAYAVISSAYPTWLYARSTTCPSTQSARSPSLPARARARGAPASSLPGRRPYRHGPAGQDGIHSRELRQPCLALRSARLLAQLESTQPARIAVPTGSGLRCS
jgi:hypothetical protein